LDLSHEIPPHDIMAGALTVSAVVPWLPAGTIVVGVVDPGVGTRRVPLAACVDARFFVGPDNGLFSLVWDRATRLTIVRLTKPRFWNSGVSSTFHGRDLFAPVAGHLAQGRSLRALGSVVTRYQRLPWPSLQSRKTSVRGAVIHIDRFGNAITNLPSELMTRHPEGWVRFRRRTLRIVPSYGFGRAGEGVAVPGSHGYVEVAVREGSAAGRCRITRGDAVEFCW
jgi:S-adenosylmethionine hydrolase